MPIDDIYYLFYEMMVQALMTENVKDGIKVSLSLLRNFLKSGNIAVYRKEDNGKYILCASDSSIDTVNGRLDDIVNKEMNIGKNHDIFNLEFGSLDQFEDIMLLNIKDGNVDCVIAITNYDKSMKIHTLFWEKLRETLQVILKRASIYERNMEAINTDLLTGLNNRTAYEARVNSLSQADEELVFGIFDLFELKRVNDKYDHLKGDMYIREAAHILGSYWPRQNKCSENCVFRIGGDEFALLTSDETLSFTRAKATFAERDVNSIDLGISENIPLGINYGIVSYAPGDDFQTVFETADGMMQEHKKLMYTRYGMEKR